MELKLSSLTEANVYKNLQSYFGKAEEVSLPAIKPKMIEQKVLALKSSIKIPAGFEEMTCKIKYNSIDESAIGDAANVYKAQTLMIRANMEKWEGDTLVGEVPVIANLRGKISDNSGITVKQNDNPDMEETYNITYYELIVDGVQIYKLDIMANVYIVNGVDLWAQRRENLGV